MGIVARGRLWQGLVDWIRPIDQATSLRSAGSMRSMSSGSLKAISDSDGHSKALSSGLSIGPLDGHEAVADDYFSTGLGEAELIDFLAADLDPVSADPAFREDLREQCWSLVKDGVTNRPKDH